MLFQYSRSSEILKKIFDRINPGPKRHIQVNVIMMSIEGGSNSPPIGLDDKMNYLTREVSGKRRHLPHPGIEPGPQH